MFPVGACVKACLTGCSVVGHGVVETIFFRFFTFICFPKNGDRDGELDKWKAVTRVHRTYEGNITGEKKGRF